MAPLIITAATTPDEIRTAQQLLFEYWDSFGFDPSFQNFSAEVSGLPGKYAQPEGRIALALIEDEPAGCIAFRRIDARRCEAKRLYVRNQFRGRGVGQTLLKWLISEARKAGYAELMADTMPSMQEALSLYQRFGFQRVGPYGSDPTPGAIYLSLILGEFRSA